MSYFWGNDESLWYDLSYHKGIYDFCTIVNNWKKAHNFENEEFTYEMFMLIDSEEHPPMDNECKHFWNKMKDKRNFVILDFIKINVESQFMYITGFDILHCNDDRGEYDEYDKDAWKNGGYYLITHLILCIDEIRDILNLPICDHCLMLYDFHESDNYNDKCYMEYKSYFNNLWNLKYRYGLSCCIGNDKFVHLIK